MKIVKGIFYLVCAVLVLLLIPVLLKHDQPIFVEVPSIDVKKIDEIRAQEEQMIIVEKKEAQKAIQRAHYNPFVVCAEDEECVIVDNHPCGCLVGSKGKTVINIKYITEFTENVQRRAGETSCPNGTPSTEGACNVNARAICQQKTCRITLE